MRKHINRIIAVTLAAAMSVSMISSISASAEEIISFPYTLFAASETEGAITTTAGNFCVNGNVCTNGTIVAGGNINVNGTKTENAGQDMIYIFDKIDTKYFSGNNVEEHTEDYVLDELNINISTPTEVLGEAELTGNININTALKAFEDVTLNGEVKNTNDSVIYSKYGDIVIDSTNVNLNGLVYAPFGSVEVKAMNLNLNNVVIIADSIVFDCPNVNANYSTNAADFVGMISEPLNIPKDEWQYMKDENGNGLPDFFEDFDNWEKLSDTDGDGLPDSIEEYLGSDVNNTDTDGDGLGDYYEVFVTYTDPTMADTDENGVSDADEDFDEDGLTNLEEFLNNTYPYIDDSDNDGLSDGDEVNEYGTDPLVADTDGDELEDGDEIILGTNPLKQDTDNDGIIDSKEKFQQTYTHKVNNEDCAVTEVIVDMECTGNINRTTTVESVMGVDYLCSEVVGLVGEPFEIETTSEFEEATLTFKIDKDKLGDIPFDNLLFLWYNEEENEFVELETTIDADNNTVSIITTHFSKYMVVDRQAWFDNWREIYARFENLSEKSPSITAICVDCSGSMRTNDKFFYLKEHVQTCYRDLAVQQFINAMFTNDKTSIITFASNATKKCSLTSDKNILLKNASFYSNGGTNANAAINIALNELDGVSGNKSIILMSDGDVNVSEDNIIIASKNKIKIHCIALGNGANSTTLKQYAENTGGEFFIVQSSSGLKDIYDNLSAKNQLNFDNLSDKDGDGVPDDIEISGIPMPNGRLIFTNPNVPDTDGDGLNDGEEVGKMSRDPSNLMSTPEQAVVYKFHFNVTSNPTVMDSDGDDIDDNIDDEPFTPHPLAVKEIRFTPLVGSNKESTICIIKMYNGDYIWRQYNNFNPEILQEYYINDDVKQQLIEYNETANFEFEPYYPWDYVFNNEATQQKQALRDLKRQVATQKILLDTEFLRDYPIITMYSDEYYGMWIKYVELRQQYDEAGLLVRDMGYLVADVVSMVPTAMDLVDSFKQFFSLHRTIRLVGGKQNFKLLNRLIKEHPIDAQYYIKSNFKSPKGLVGQDFENYLVELFGGEGSFNMDGREFDGRLENRWWEAKSGNAWNVMLDDPKKMANFKSSMPQRAQIAQKHGATYELFSNTPIPESIKEWLIQKNIPFTEILF